MDSQSSKFSRIPDSITPPHIPYPIFPTRLQSGPGLIPNPNSPAAIREILESCIRSPLDVSLDRPKTLTIEKDMDSQSSQFSRTPDSITPPNIPYPMFPTQFQSGRDLIPHQNSPAAIRELIEPCLRPPLDAGRQLFVPPSFVDEPMSMVPSFPFEQPQLVQQSIKMSTLPVTSEEHKKEKKEKMKKKKEKREKHKKREEKINDQKDKSEKQDKLDKIKKKKEKKQKRKEKEASKKLPKEENLDKSVTKISRKLGLAEDLPLFTPDKALPIKPIKIIIKPLKKPEEDVKRERTPEPARISALASRPPKQKSTKGKAEAVPENEDTEEDKENGGNSLPAKLGVIVDSSGRTVWFCPTCGEEDDGSPMIACDDCDAWYHWVCVGIQVAPPEDVDWYCLSCTVKKRISKTGKHKKISKS